MTKDDNGMVPNHLRLRPGQQELTPEQIEALRQFVREHIVAYLSTAPVDEAEAETWLRQAYTVAGLEPPQHIRWFDSPMQLVRECLPTSVGGNIRDDVDGAWKIIDDATRRAIRDGTWTHVTNHHEELIYKHDNIWSNILRNLWDTVGRSLEDAVAQNIQLYFWDTARDTFTFGNETWSEFDSFEIDSSHDPIWDIVFACSVAGIWAYHDAELLITWLFLDTYLAPNDLAALAHFSEMVSGHMPRQDAEYIVRKPRILARDENGWLHNATGKAVEYRDGWGFYAWHGVRVPEKVILDPDGLTKVDFLSERNAEVRRIIRERMGSRFISELDGHVIHERARGRLWRVMLPPPFREYNEDDEADGIETMFHYLQVKDASTPREYFLRVPPTIETADEAVAWTFGMAAEEYQPGQET